MRVRRRSAVVSFLLLFIALAGCGFRTAADGQDLGPGPGIARPYEPDTTVATRVLVPKVYELANVVLALAERARDTPWSVNKAGPYYRRVLEHFGPHADHELIRGIGPRMMESFRPYYSFRENAFSYRFDDDGRMVHAGVYFDVWPSSDLFTRHLELVEDFARASGFREFYEAERGTYEDQRARYRELVDLAAMAGWLHARFPGRRMDAYTVVFSPLIGGSHSTRNFEIDGEREAVMFIAGPDLALGDVDASTLRGLHERLVFTEIDHNYVNPVTLDFRRRVNRVFDDWKGWNQGGGYTSPRLTFNEYMTWGVFTLYAADTYDEATFMHVNTRTEDLMVDGRRFVRYREFNRELLRRYRELEPATVRDLYEPILGWAGTVPARAAEPATNRKR